jgi:hypothetical protein
MLQAAVHESNAVPITGEGLESKLKEIESQYDRRRHPQGEHPPRRGRP